MLLVFWAGLGMGSALGEQGTNAPSKPNPLAFRPTNYGWFEFDTGILKGFIRQGGFVINPLHHVPTTNQLTYCNGLFSPFPVMTAGQAATHPGSWPSTNRLREDGSLEIHWPNVGSYVLTMVYRLAAADTIDVELEVSPKQKLEIFEFDLQSFIHPEFSNSLVYVQDDQGPAVVPRFQAADPANGEWQMYPREPSVVGLVNDGRWEKVNGRAWSFMPLLAKPLAVRIAPHKNLAVLFMSPPDDCFAISTPCQPDSGKFRLNTTSLALFGRDLKPGETARARARFKVLENPTELRVLEACQQYLFNPVY